MKIIHTSDWHLGQKFYRMYDRDEEHAHFFAQLVELIRGYQPDALLVSGDVFDTAAPSNATQRRLVEHLLSLHRARPEMTIVVTAGNHDSASLIEVSRQLWGLQNVHMVGAVPRREDGSIDLERLVIPIEGKGRIVALPHMWNGLYPSVDGLEPDGLPVVVMAHLAVRGCDFRGHAQHHILNSEALIGNLEQRDLDVVGTAYDYLALGHIHSAQSLSPRARYCGSPIPLSFDEPKEHSVSLVEVEARGEEPRITPLAVGYMRGMTTLEADSPQEALSQLQQLPYDTRDYIRILLHQADFLSSTDEAALAQAAALLEGARYCGVELRRKEVQCEKTMFQLTASELRNHKPLEVARLYVESMQGQLDDETALLFQQVVNEVTDNKNQ